MRLRAYACAVDGITHGVGAVVWLVASTGIVIVPMAGIEGPENGAAPTNPADAPRVSTRRHGAMGENWSPCAEMETAAKNSKKTFIWY